MEPEIIKAGDDAGNRMVVKFTSPEGVVIHGIGVPQAWDSPLGPTWCYLVEGDQLTLVDAGCNGTLADLEQGLEYVGYPLSAVGRMVVTHGHLDHDGNCYDVVARSGAELWAHEVYGSLLGLDRWNMEADWRQRLVGVRRRDGSEFEKRILEHERRGKMMSLTNPVTDGMVSDGLTFYYTPGHSPDELCILYGRILFSGDHVLPQITPHPSVSMSYQRFRSLLPEDYQFENRYYGLKTFIRSLKRVSKLGDDLSVMPAHRAYHGGKFNPIGVDRALVIAGHHRSRCFDFVELLRKGPMELSTLTRKHFSHLRLDDRIYYAAFSEVVSHIEFLEELGDVSMIGTEGRMVQWNGTENFSSYFDQD